MAAPQRPTSGLPTRRTTTRQQPTRRAGSTVSDRHTSQASPSASAKAPAVSRLRALKPPSTPASVTAKRKERDIERNINEDTSIHVVVRCRGRNEREVKENSGVALQTEGVKGKTVELSMGPNAVSNKTYTFDKVFSAAADQVAVYEDVVVPMVNEMLAGYNCTIFAYGQTGTGKTYTMSGDMTDTLGILSDNAGIIPRVLYSLFGKLADTESTVKCSFIELYNEELRDLLSAEENSKLKIYENEQKKGHNGSTLVQGMEETYIDTATSGIKLLQQGSHKRQVAATKCNDLSSRSHTVFSITVNTKRTTESGEEYVCPGKLNLVDLAGSENIQRSGAENKRATEAGLINKSLLTLGRVINALVDKSLHIPYRESKLTRLLQDSLGGRTKTCIIATISPARGNLEETISTLDYAFRAKNIRNKPQINSTMPKKTLLREFTSEIEKLKGELIATRHRNGVYMSVESYEEMTMENDSRRIINEEQRAKIESMESSLRNKVQELFTLTSKFNNLKQDNEETRAALNSTNDVLQQTEIVLQNTRAHLEEEELLRIAHQQTENQLHDIGKGLVSTLNRTVQDIDGLHTKLDRKAELDTSNTEIWQLSTAEVFNVTKQIDNRVEDFQLQHAKLVESASSKLTNFITDELSQVERTRSDLSDFTRSLDKAHHEAKTETSGAHDEMNNVLEEIKDLREEVKSKVGEGLNGLSAAAARISEEVIGEFSEFHAQLHTSYSNLGKDMKSIFEAMTAHLAEQKNEIDKLRGELQSANRQNIETTRKASSHLAQTLEEEHVAAETERDVLMSQIKVLIEESRQKQFGRLRTKMDTLRTDISSSGDMLEQATTQHDRHVDEWVFKSEQFSKDVDASKDEIRTRMQSDWEAFDQRNSSIQKATESVHKETVRIVDAQMSDMGRQMEALDDFVAKARSQNGRYRDSHVTTLDSIATDVRQSYSSVQEQVEGLGGRMNQLQEESAEHQITLRDSTLPLSEDVRKPLSDLSSSFQNRPLEEYVVTGVTPLKRKYEYPAVLPSTESYETLKSRLRTTREMKVLPFNDEEHVSTASSPGASPSKGFVYNDTEDEVGTHAPSMSTGPSSNTGLREVDSNVAARPLAYSTDDKPPARQSTSAVTNMGSVTEVDDIEPPTKRRRSSSTLLEAKLPQKMVAKKMAGMMEGRENVPPPGVSSGRRLRNRPSP
ncbi:P-loop containing nucleoside triphosphate hydrolase protein [Aspergillus cavernicola]|uniref:P-loop containing nucleoside triphosphate hydrolase protein n=1 Tax=Aspergillus cavernicola TaxID=176166 RepID=A0ABR4I6U1_9EURO